MESAEIILRESDNYEISIYHSHQAIEKIIKASLLKKDQNFKFSHDINALFLQAFGSKNEALLEKVSYVNSLYPQLRYPGGDKMTKDQAEKCLRITKELFSKI